MTTVLAYAAMVCVLAGLVSGTVTLLITRRVRVALGTALDLLLAAALIQLALPFSPWQLPAAVAVMAARLLTGPRPRARPDR
ncbi:hypothetical protein [Actinoplanes rectilineatus]|uniref:hypothetical protein n=1 Tax=Actinoplanes rectilineatus TaxID=113571 RepID=UPI0005F2B9C2|nr:hypothetical protein [Actinoplanes rectilineatus]